MFPETASDKDESASGETVPEGSLRSVSGDFVAWIVLLIFIFLLCIGVVNARAELTNFVNFGCRAGERMLFAREFLALFSDSPSFSALLCFFNLSTESSLSNFPKFSTDEHPVMLFEHFGHCSFWILRLPSGQRTHSNKRR